MDVKKKSVSDTTTANNGRNIGAITQLFKHFDDIGVGKAEFIRCEHRILDIILKYVLNDI